MKKNSDMIKAPPVIITAATSAGTLVFVDDFTDAASSRMNAEVCRGISVRSG